MERKSEGRVIRIERTDSTNDEAFRLKEKYGVPLFVRADVQTAGRGRMGRRWISNLGGLWMSGLFRKREDKDNLKLMIGAATVVKGVVSPLLKDLPVELHFPNDIFVKGRKLAGVLVEEREGLVVVGVGLNVNQKVPPIPTATTMRLLTGKEFPLDALSERIAEGLLEIYDLSFKEVFGRWREELATIGRRISVWVAGGGEVVGRLMDVDRDLVLHIRHEDGAVYIPAAYVLSVSEV
ncbi:MAG: biotin--[acetyl-CoA-carboxylase] ligase [Thermotogae bacterium]|nr:biotin--[acetyl-CoA-carboxylase] ligase [Thermotogota bacterium]